MPHLNNYQFIGHLGRKPSLKELDGKYVAEFTVAVSSGTMKNPDTIWVKCSVWGDRSSKVVEKLDKGDAVYVSGRLKLRTYQGKDGTWKSEASVFVNEWQSLSGKKSDSIPEFDDAASLKSDGLDGIPFK